jgi:MFS family permease
MLEKHVWRDFAAVTFSVAVLGIGLGSTLPLTALVLNARGFGPDVVGWMVAASALGGIAGTLGSPAATMRFGRRRVMLGCVALATASVMPLQYMSSLWGWTALRLMFGASMAPLFVLGEAWISTLPGDAVRGRVVAIYTTSFTVFQVMGPLLTNALSHFPNSVFLISGGIFLLGAPGIALARDGDGRDRQPATGESGGEKDSRADKDFRAENDSRAKNDSRAEKDANASWAGIVRKAPAIIAGAAFFAAFDSIVLSFLPLVALNYGFSRSRALGAAAMVMAGDATLQFAAGALADRYGRARVQLIYGGLMCLLLPLLPVMLHSAVWWAVYLYLLGGVAGAVYTLSLVASGDYFTGAALLRTSGLIALTWNIAGTVGPIVTGVAMKVVGNWGVAAVLWVMAVGLFGVLLRSEGRRALRSEFP